MRIPHLRAVPLLLPAAALFGRVPGPVAVVAQEIAPPAVDLRTYDIVQAPSAERLEADIRTLVGFGTRNTMSDTLSETRGIGAARRWIKAELDRISEGCGGCLEVSYQRDLVEGDPRSRIEEDDGVEYGDVLEGVDFDFAARMTAVNAAVLAALAWAPPAPENVRIGGAVAPSTTLAWDAVDHPDLAGYRIYWRDTTAPRWEHSRFVGKVTEHTLEDLVIDNYLFGVAAVGTRGSESVVSFPTSQLRRR